MNVDKISVIGGDLRIIKLVEMLAEDTIKIKLYGLEKAEELKNIKNISFCNNINELINDTNIVVGPIPFSKDNIKINTPFSNNEITIKSLIEQLKGKTFIAGSVKEEHVKNFENNNIKIIDVMKNEELVILNTIATAEGAIKEAIINTDIILHKSNLLILGFGRVAKTLAHKFSALDVNVTCAARKKEDLAWIDTYGYNSTNINFLGENLKDYDIIINTVPHLILDKERLNYVRKDCLLMDVSSKPGGIDEEYANNNGINMKWALALPGKVAPKTTAGFIKKVIYELL